MKGRIAIAIFIVLLVFGGLAGVKTLQIQKLIAAGAAYTEPPESVSSAIAREEKWQDTVSAVGTITAVQGVNVSAEVAGTVAQIAFESGAVVKKGDLLIKLDTTSEEAQLRAAEAKAHLAQLDSERVRKLRDVNTVSQAELDTALANLKQTEADADAIRAQIAKKTIRAPFDGRLGIRLVNVGEYLDTGKPIVSLQSLSPVYAEFSLPQQELAQLKTGLPVRLTTDTYTNQEFEGRITAINPDLDQSTRSVRIQATLENADQQLRPGMFARVHVLLPGEKNVLVIPATAVLSAPYGNSVYVIESATNGTAGLVVRQQFIRTGRARGDFVSVENGLKPGDRIVSAGLFKLRNNMAVTINNEIKPKASNAPSPEDG